MEDFVSKLKQTAGKVVAEAEKLTSVAVSKTGNLVSQTKMNYTINSNEGKIKEIFSEIGRYIYDEYKKGAEVSEDILEKFEIVDEMFDEINELKTKIADMKNAVICEECGEYNSQESTFCSKCGAQLK